MDIRTRMGYTYSPRACILSVSGRMPEGKRSLSVGVVNFMELWGILYVRAIMSPVELRSLSE